MITEQFIIDHLGHWYYDKELDIYYQILTVRDGVVAYWSQYGTYPTATPLEGVLEDEYIGEDESWIS